MVMKNKNNVFNSIVENPEGVKFESQEPKEKVYFILRKHPITNLGWISTTLILIIMPIAAMALSAKYGIDTFKYIPAKYQAIVLMLWYLVTLFLAFESFLLWYFNTYIITDKRVIDVDFTGLWSKRISEAPLDNVEDATYETTKFLHVLFDYGNIFMQTAAERTEFEFNSIPRPGLVHDKLTDLVDEYKRRHDRD